MTTMDHTKMLPVILIACNTATIRPEIAATKLPMMIARSAGPEVILRPSQLITVKPSKAVPKKRGYWLDGSRVIPERDAMLVGISKYARPKSNEPIAVTVMVRVSLIDFLLFLRYKA